MMPPPMILGAKQRRRQGADLLRFVGEAEPQDDRPAANRIGEARIEVELGTQPVERRDVAAVVLEIALRQPLENVDARRSVRFGEHDVESDGPRLIAIQQLGRQSRQLVARPRPASFALQAGLVDVDDDDLGIISIRQRQLEPRVVRDRFELREQRRLAELRQRMQQEDGE